MKLKTANDDFEITHLTHCLVSENDLVQIGIFKVLFGYRIRAGFKDNHAYCELDWCAGNDWKNVQRLYSLAVAILSKREEGFNCFEGIPKFSNIKPFFLDKEFSDTLISLAGPDVQLLVLEKKL